MYEPYKRTRWREAECEHCGGVFLTSRRDTKYCSAKCRVAVHRIKKKRRPKVNQSDIDWAEREIEKIEQEGKQS